MILFKYLDLLPPIPAELLFDPIPNFDSKSIGYTDGNNVNEATYTRWQITSDLADWINSNIVDGKTFSGIQIMSWNDHVPPGQRKVNPHCDQRQWALNYIYEPGGDSVSTSFYSEPGHNIIRAPGTRLKKFDQLELVESVILEPGRWHILNTRVLHGVTNVATTRKAVTIGINIENPLDVIRNY